MQGYVTVFAARVQTPDHDRSIRPSLSVGAKIRAPTQRLSALGPLTKRFPRT
jgi:hypothetical protein